MNGRGNIIFILIFLVLFASVLYMLVTTRIQLNELLDKKEELEATLEEYSYRVDELEYELEKEIDDDYIIKIARERLGLHLPDEKIFYHSLFLSFQLPLL